MKIPIAYLFVFPLLWAACFRYHPCDIDVATDALTQKNLSRLQASQGDNDTVFIAFIGDTQRFYDATENCVTSVNKYQYLDFVIVAGDLTDFGISWEYNFISATFAKLNAPYLTVIGNHDLVYQGKELYEKMYGALDYAFSYKGFRFIFLNTNSREFDFNGNVPDLNWLEYQLSSVPVGELPVIVAHVPPDSHDFDPKLRSKYLKLLTSYKCFLTLNGHNHDHASGVLAGTSVPFINSYSTAKRRFVLLKIWQDEFSFTRHTF